MDIFTIGAFIFLNAFLITSGFAFFTAIGNYWVRRPAPQWLAGTGLYCHRFLDGLEYSLTRTAIAAGMARNILILKCLPKTTKTAAPKLKLETKPIEPVASPPIPEFLKLALSAVMKKSQTGDGAEPSVAAIEDIVDDVVVPDVSATTKKLRSRSRIAPPKLPVA